MTFWTPDTLRAACAGSWLIRPPQIELPKDRPADLPLPPLHHPISGLGTDTRTLQPQQAFLALKGENHDGHDYLEQAVRTGAPILIVSDAARVPPEGFDPPVGVMHVADTGQALLRIAAAYRRTLERTKVVAVCGSNGKTTTTRLIELLLGTALRGTASQKSFNNAVGVPLTILRAKPGDQYLVCEVGTNAPGEIAALGEVVSPDVVVITSIGREHLEGLGDLAGVAREEASILKHLRPKGSVVANVDCPELIEHVARLPAGTNLIGFGVSPDAALRLTEVAQRVEGGRPVLEFTVNGRLRCRLPMLGAHNAHNALAALAVARRLGIDEQKAAAALANAAPADMRLQWIEVAGLRVINDAYNANPDSMIAGIRTLVSVAGEAAGGGRVVAVLGDMLELGAASEESHRLIGRTLLEAAKGPGPGVNLVVLVGERMAAARDELLAGGWSPECLEHVPEADERRAARVAGLLRSGDLVLLKGSRRMRLERVLEAMKAAAPAAAPGPTVCGGSPLAAARG